MQKTKVLEVRNDIVSLQKAEQPEIKSVDDSNGFNNTKANRTVNERISAVLLSIGLSAKLKGYKFIREAIRICIYEPNYINNLTTKLYPVIAKRFDTTPINVERAIRHAVIVAWNSGKIDNINNLLGIKIYKSGDRPTSGEIIALIADKLLMENLI